VLRLEFSHCFDVRIVSSTPVSFMRANINQAAILFSGEVRFELRYRYTP
jgi:hypothetical protein